MHSKFIKKPESQLPFLLMFIDNVDWRVDKILRILNISTLAEKEMRMERNNEELYNELMRALGEVEDQTKIRGSSPKGHKINISL